MQRVTFVSMILVACGCQKVEPTGAHQPVAASPKAVAKPAEATPVASTATVESTPDQPSPAVKKPRDPIYLEEPNGRELVAAALEKARGENKNVLIEFGGNWCGWCYKLHDVFHDDPLVHPIVEKSFELVLVDSNSNRDLMEEYGGKETRYSFPHLVVLDGAGKVLTNQETGSLEIGPKHDPQKVADFLTAWTPEGIAKTGD